MTKRLPVDRSQHLASFQRNFVGLEVSGVSDHFPEKSHRSTKKSDGSGKKSYRSPKKSDGETDDPEPISVHLHRVPCRKEITNRKQITNPAEKRSADFDSPALFHQPPTTFHRFLTKK